MRLTTAAADDAAAIGARTTVRRCARPGNDVIRSFAGNDVVDGGVGEDTIDPGPERDVVVGRGGDDVVAVVDGERDLVLCGAGVDRVVADHVDDMKPSCETVERRPR